MEEDVKSQGRAKSVFRYPGYVDWSDGDGLVL